MSEYSVGDRVLVPGVVAKTDEWMRPGEVKVDLGGGFVAWLSPDDLRPDTGGRDLTASDVAGVLNAWENFGPGVSSIGDFAAKHLNRIARGDRPTGAGDVNAMCGCEHPRYMHLNGGDWCKGGGWYDRNGAACGCLRFAAAGPRAGDTACPNVSDIETPAGDTASDDEEVRMVELALRCAETGEATHWPTAAAFLAQEIHRLRSQAVADDEVIATLRSAYDHACAGWRQRADELAAERDAARSDAAALRAVGNKLADKAELSSGVDVRACVTAWRSVAGGEQT